MCGRLDDTKFASIESRHGNIEICYDTFGSTENEPLVLVMGLGTQMIAWRPEFCEFLAQRGFFVVRYDNRDIGLSSKLHHLGTPSVGKSLIRKSLALEGNSDQHYNLDDMAQDCLALMDYLNFPTFHICGASMGGMIAQTVCLLAPQRVRSLDSKGRETTLGWGLGQVSVMSTTGDLGLPGPDLKISLLLLQPPAKTADEVVEQTVEFFRAVSGPRYFDEGQMRQYLSQVVARDADKLGVPRQLNAVLKSSGRSGRLRSIRCPALVIHGTVDPLIPVECGRATARAIPGSVLMEIQGMGHELPPVLFETLAQNIANNARRRFLPSSSLDSDLQNRLAFHLPVVHLSSPGSSESCTRCRKIFSFFKAKRKCGCCGSLCCIPCTLFTLDDVAPNSDGFHIAVCGSCCANFEGWTPQDNFVVL